MTTDQQALYDFLKGSLPAFFFSKDSRADEMFLEAVYQMAQAKTQVDEWQSYTYILSAITIWLDQHARDRGTMRAANETEAALRARLRAFQDAVIPSAVVAAASAAMTADGVSPVANYPALVETRRDRAYMEDWGATPTAVGSTANRKMAYLSRGYRMTGRRGAIIVILPYGTTEATRKSVDAAVDKKKAGGFNHVVERRVNP